MFIYAMIYAWYIHIYIYILCQSVFRLLRTRLDSVSRFQVSYRTLHSAPSEILREPRLYNTAQTSQSPSGFERKHSKCFCSVFSALLVVALAAHKLVALTSQILPTVLGAS